MKVKGTILRTRKEFLKQEHGPDAPGKLLAALGEQDRLAVERAMPGSWVPFRLANTVDETIARVFAEGSLEVCREIGAFSASQNLSSVYKMFMDQSAGDPQRLMENLATLHGTIYDWGWTRAVRAEQRLCRLEGDYEGEATRANCLSAVGFYSEALRLLGIEGVEVEEMACQATGAELCVYGIRWTG